jgi:hypothetical protein
MEYQSGKPLPGLAPAGAHGASAERISRLQVTVPGVTLALLWEEYRGVHPDGYGYSRYCELYRVWEGRLSPVMRQGHVAGERLFVDYAGATLDVICSKTGEVREAQLFVATLGASSYTYVEATWTQSLPDWIASHVRAFAFFGYCNLKSGNSFGAGAMSPCRGQPRQGLPTLVFHGVAKPTMEKCEWTDTRIRRSRSSWNI